MNKSKMFSNKKGLSDVVTTLIIILLVIVAIGIVWIVVRGVIESGTEEIDYGSKCLQVSIQTTAVDCTAGTTCLATIKRNAGGEPIDGIKFIFSNTTAQETGNPVDYPTTIASLETKTTTPLTHGLATVGPNKVEIAPYFEDDSGVERLCGISHSFTF